MINSDLCPDLSLSTSPFTSADKTIAIEYICCVVEKLSVERKYARFKKSLGMVKKTLAKPDEEIKVTLREKNSLRS
jgi:hypothetical protein